MKYRYEMGRRTQPEKGNKNKWQKHFLTKTAVFQGTQISKLQIIHHAVDDE